MRVLNVFLLHIMQGMTVFPYKLGAPMYWYTTSIVDQVMELALEVLEGRTPKPVLEMSQSGILLSRIP